MLAFSISESGTKEKNVGNFKPFGTAFAKHFAAMSKHELYRVDIDGQEVWDKYLASFPAGTNEIFRVRTEHDGSYDRNVIRRIGNVVAIIDQQLVSVWDIAGLEHPYDVVAAELAAWIKRFPVHELFRIKENKLGYVTTTERLDNGAIKTWDHFHVDIATKHFTREVDTVLGNARTTVEMFQRANEELQVSAIDTVLDLISENALYRGTEFKPALLGFKDLCTGFKSAHAKDQFLWAVVQSSPHARFKNTAIGTLVTDLSEGVELEQAVKSFEAKVAPTNYKRPTALITQGMVKAAMQTINDLGLESALERRYAKLSDVSVNNVLWVNGTAASKMKGGVEDLLMGSVVAKAPKNDAIEEIGITQFVQEVLPKASNLEILFKNSLQRNLVSLTAPANEDVAQLFKWENNFGWSYNGEITDSIKEKVKTAGGNVDADLRVSLAWFNGDDLDLHSQSPHGHVYFGNKLSILDVDMNAGYNMNKKDPVENQSWMKPRDGEYQIYVHQFCKRHTRDPGFQIEIECGNQKHSLSYERAVSGNIQVAQFTMVNGEMTKFKVASSTLKHQGISQPVWGINTETFVKVDTLLLSPNHWDDNMVGNKHWFFIMEGCNNPEGTRGIYNEFLRGSLETHRKVFEVLGSKTRCPASSEQLSGLGFSSTRGDEVTVRVIGTKINKTYKVKFA